MRLVLEGAKGSKGGGSQRTPVEAANTLRSVSKGRILDLIVHGPIEGLAEGLKSVILDDTPLQNADGSFNFDGVVVTTRQGYPDQEIIPGFRAVENLHDVSTEVKYGAPVVRAMTNQDADSVVVSVRLNALSKQDKKTGDLTGHSVAISIHTRVNGGAWANVRYDTISGKTTSAYQRSYRIDLNSPGEWEVKVVRESADDADSSTQSATFWADMTEIVDARLNYPDSALVGIEVDAKLFGNQMPSRAYDMKLSIIKVPSNYDPITRAYTGIWNGSFKMAWTDNPAWCYYDLATHPVIGAGLVGVDKWALYQIGRYCDELVPDGFGGTEPRFTLNTLFAERTEAITTLTTLASVFRGMTYWGTNTVVPVADQPVDPRKLVGPSNVVGGEFEYAGTSLKERHSVAIVMWNDPADKGKAKPEIIEDPDSIDLFGWREVQVTAFGCTSRGQANRLGRWILYSERMETETVAYTAVADQADVRPGDVIEISDPDRAGARLSGRVVTSGLNQLTLDKVPVQATGSAWFISVMMPNGVIQRRQVISFSGNVVGMATPLTGLPLLGAMWILSSVAVVPPQYRVSSVSEKEDGLTYDILATEYDPRKYSAVELGIKLADVSHSLVPVGAIAAATGINVKAYTYLAGGTEHQGLAISWVPSKDVRVSSYVAEVKGPTDVQFRTAHSGAGVSFDEKDVAPGEWLIRVKAQNSLGVSSAWASIIVQVSDLLIPSLPDTVDVEAATFSVVLRPRSIYPGANYEFWRSTVALTDALVESNAVRLSVSSNLVDPGLRSNTQYYYYVRGANAYGVSVGWYPVQAKTLANFDDIITALDSDLRKPGGLFEDMIGESTNAAKIAAAAEVAEARGEINEVRTDVQAVRGEIDSAVAGVSLISSDVSSIKIGLTDLQTTSQIETVRYLASLAMHEGNTARASTEEAVRATDDEALAVRITNLGVEFEGNTAIFNERILTLVDADHALTTRITDMRAAVTTDISAAVSEEAVARVTADTSIVSYLTSINAAVGDTHAALTAEVDARVTADTALIGAVEALGAQNDNAAAIISEEITARATADTALSNSLTTISAQLNDTHTLLTNEITARVAADSALVSQNTKLSTTFGDFSASVSQQFTAQSSYTDGAVARATTTVTVNGVRAVLGLSSNGIYSDIGAVADRFYVYNPYGGTYTLAFAVVGGQTVIQDALIRTASITEAKIADGNITNAKIANGHITTAKIADGQITNAKIGYLAVDTINLNGNAVTIPSFATAFGSIYSTSPVPVLTLVVTLAEPGWLYASSSGFIAYGGGWGQTNTQLKIAGTVVSQGGGESAWTSAAHSGAVYLPAGTYSVELVFSSPSGKGNIDNRSLFAMVVKR